MKHSIYIEFTKNSSPTFLNLFLKSLHTFRGFKINLILPLCYLEQVKETIPSDVADSDQIQLINSFAYARNSVLPTNIAAEEIMLNEYALGYFFGKKKGFEGEDAILIKDLDFLYITEKANISSTLSAGISLGYKSFIIKASNIDLEPGLYFDDALGIDLIVVEDKYLFTISENPDINVFRDSIFDLTESTSTLCVREYLESTDHQKLDLKSLLNIEVSKDPIDAKLPVLEGLEVLKIWDTASVISIENPEVVASVQDFISQHQALS